MKNELLRIAERIEIVRKNSRLPSYQQAELTEIKYSIRKLSEDAKYLIMISKTNTQPIFIKSKDPSSELALRGFKVLSSTGRWFNPSNMLNAEIFEDVHEEWPQI